MPAIINSAPECIQTVKGALPADDSADFILQHAYEKCAGIMTFGPGTTYGEEGTGAAGAYMVLVWLGIVVTFVVLVYWLYWENKRLTAWTAKRRAAAAAPTEGA